MSGHHLTELTLDQIDDELYRHLTQGEAADVNPATALLARAARLTTPDPSVDERYKYHVIADELAAWIGQVDEGEILRCRDMLPADFDATCDPDLFETVLRAGVNPYAMLLVALCVNAPTTVELPFGQDGGEYGQISMIEDGGDHWEIMVKLQNDVHWTGSRLLVRSGVLPHTVLQAMIGRPTSAVMDHPLLRDAGVVQAVGDETGGYVDLDVADRPRRAWRRMR